jgi:hypothetical protein
MERFLMLGRQHLYLTSEEAKASAILRPFSKDLDALRRNSGGYGESFLGALGMKHIDSLDYSDYEGATVVHNLNEPVPASWEERHDLVFDGGSLEHVFQFPIALESCMRMVKQGGHFVSITTSNNYNGHGFYQFSAELFFRVFSRENGFSLTLAAFAESRRGGRLYRVDDPAERRHRILFQGKGPMLILLVARRALSSLVPRLKATTLRSGRAEVIRAKLPNDVGPCSAAPCQPHFCPAMIAGASPDTAGAKPFAGFTR